MKGGNAADAMIAGLLCVGVVNPQSSGLGGGFIMTLYNSTEKKCISIDAREAAPSSANSTMFVGRVEEAFSGYRAIATPGELHGCWTVFQKYGSGRVTWKQLFEPSIKLAREGFPVSTHLAYHLNENEALKNDMLKDPELTLMIAHILNEIICGPPPPSSFAVTQSIVGVMAQFYKHNQKIDFYKDSLFYHRLIEAEKFAYAIRTKLGDIAFVQEAKKLVENMTKPAYAEWIASLIKNTSQPDDYYSLEKTAAVEDHGTSHLVVIDAEGNAVSATSTVNQYFGAKRVSPTFGIIYNDQMDDFSTPGTPNAFGLPSSPANFIEPGKRPMSSMSPTIVYFKKNGKVKMAVGASGGSRIISAVAQTLIRTLLFNQTIKEAFDAPRFHNQYLPLDPGSKCYQTEVEISAPKALIDALSIVFKQNFKMEVKQASVVQAL